MASVEDQAVHNMNVDSESTLASREGSVPGLNEKREEEENWARSPHNPWNWPSGKKVVQVVMLSMNAFLA